MRKLVTRGLAVGDWLTLAFVNDERTDGVLRELPEKLGAAGLLRLGFWLRKPSSILPQTDRTVW